MSKNRRERELLRISKENANLLKRIANKKPAISHDQHLEDWNQKMIYMNNISSFSEDWYLKNGKRHSKKSKSLQDVTQSETTAKDSTEDYGDDEFEEEKEKPDETNETKTDDEQEKSTEKED